MADNGTGKGRGEWPPTNQRPEPEPQSQPPGGAGADRALVGVDSPENTPEPETAAILVFSQVSWTASWTGERMSSGSEDEGHVRYESDYGQGQGGRGRGRGQGHGHGRGRGKSQRQPPPSYAATMGSSGVGGAGGGRGVGGASETATRSQHQGQGGQGHRPLSEAVLALAELTAYHPVMLRDSVRVAFADSQSSVHKSITKYVENSSSMKKNKLKVKVENIFMCEARAPKTAAAGNGNTSFLSSALNTLGLGSGSSSSNQKGAGHGHGHGPGPGPSYRMLLWYSAPQSAIGSILVNGFKLRPSGLLVFYDRASKVLANWEKPEHGLLLCCEVALDKVYKSPHGAGFWGRGRSSVPLPHGYDTVKGTGAWMPDWSENHSHEGAIIPAGPTIPNPMFSNYEQEFNEYIIVDASRARVKFVVEVRTK